MMRSFMWLPGCLPDELLISRMFRYVTLFGWNGLSRVYELLGSRKKSIHPLLTSGLNVIASDLSPNDTSQKLLFHQTLAPIFLFFLTDHRVAIKQAMLNGKSSSTLRECQFPASGNGSSIILKSCPICARSDIINYGVAYWHRMHQMPGVSVCSEHAIILNIVNLYERQRLKPGFLPNPNNFTSRGNEMDLLYSRFCRDILCLCSDNYLYLEPIKLYKIKLMSEGYITANGRVRHHRLMSAFYNEMLSLGYSGVELLPSKLNDYGYLHHLLNKEFSVHPVRHLLFSFWLFRKGYELLNAQSQEQLLTTSSMSFPGKEKNNDAKNVVDFLKNNVSINKISMATGKSRGYIKKIASVMNIEVTLRPRKITNDIKSKIIKVAAAGFHRKVIASLFDVSIGSVEQVISGCDGLVELRRRCHYQSFFRRCKCHILRYRKQHPCATRKEIKICCSADFYWLYNHERTLLESILPTAIKPSRKQKNMHS